MISVCIATHNGEKYIFKQLQSILYQINKLDEVLISDDNSTDRTLQIIKNINDERIKIFYNNFSSPIKNFEFLIEKSNGNIIFLSDQDDVWEHNKVESHLKQYNQNTSVGLVISNLQLIDKFGKPIIREFYKSNFTSKLYKNLIYNNYIGCSISFRSSLKKYLLPFPKYIPMHDWWIGIISSIYTNIYFINDKLVYYRIHENNFTIMNKNSLFKKVLIRLILIYSILLRIVKLKL